MKTVIILLLLSTAVVGCTKMQNAWDKTKTAIAGQPQ
jgi:hypothetical protein